MEMFFFKAEQLTPIRYYRYTSWVTDRFFEIRYDDKLNPWIRVFEALKDKAKKMYMDISEAQDGSEIRTQQWDNKVVIECLTSNGNILFVGYKDGGYVLGLGRDGDKWVKPYHYKPIGYNPK